MRVVIQSTEDLRYVTEHGDWSFNPQQAYDFETVILAQDFIQARDLHDAAVVLQCEPDDFGVI
ncbi:MAG TPA: hypothetical protein VEH27_13470 [Methylomirabilota bacterium]|nr:hypothetical protein [Methylomirabilota bacterium]